MLNCSRVKTHQLRNICKLLVVICHTFHLELDFQIHNSFMEVFRKLSSLILLCPILISPLNLLFPFYLQLLLFLVGLLSLLLLRLISSQIFRSSRSCSVPLFCASIESHRLLRCCVRSLLAHIRACEHHLPTFLPSGVFIRFH